MKRQGLIHKCFALNVPEVSNDPARGSDRAFAPIEVRARKLQGLYEIMNIFFLDKDPVKAAQLQCDKHVVKMVLETAQMISTAVRSQGHDVGYKSAYPKHPMTIWVNKSNHNFAWALEHGLALGEEYTHRYNKIHASHKMLKMIQDLKIKGNANYMTTPPQCMPDEYKKISYVDAYRNYYVNDKKYFAKYTNRDVPEFMK